MSLYPAFARPSDLGQAAEIMTGLSTGAMIIAGGQELMPSINYGTLMPEVYIDIGQIAVLKGISKENKHLIFEPKFTTKTSGMGLGLPMIKKIIETYEGSISFTSEENVGTIFTVILPKS